MHFCKNLSTFAEIKFSKCYDEKFKSNSYFDRFIFDK